MKRKNHERKVRNEKSKKSIKLERGSNFKWINRVS